MVRFILQNIVREFLSLQVRLGKRGFTRCLIVGRHLTGVGRGGENWTAISSFPSDSLLACILDHSSTLMRGVRRPDAWASALAFTTSLSKFTCSSSIFNRKSFICSNDMLHLTKLCNFQYQLVVNTVPPKRDKS